MSSSETSGDEDCSELSVILVGRVDIVMLMFDLMIKDDPMK